MTMAGRRTRRVKRAFWLGLLISVAVHLIILLLVIRSMSPPDTTPRTPDLLVGLLPIPSVLNPAEPRPAPVAVRPRARPQRPPQTGSPPTPGAPAASSTPAAATLSNPAAQPLDILAGQVRQALRASVGCANPDSAHLSDEERAACRRSVREANRDTPAYDVIPADPAKAADFERETRKAEAMRRFMEGSMPAAPHMGGALPPTPCEGPSCSH